MSSLCCPHCIGTMSRLESLDGRLDEIAQSVAEMRAEFGIVKKVVYGAASAVGLSFVGALAVVAWRTMGL